MKFILGRKRGMTQLFDESGKVHPVTVVEAGPCVVTCIRTQEKNGYQAVQVGFEDVRESRLTKAQLGQFKKDSLPPKRHLAEERVAGEISLKVGDKVTVEGFEAGELVDVVGKSKGKGFQGTVRAHHFSMGPRSHGSMNIRQPGTVGAGTGMAKVLKGLRMAKHLGDVQTTSKNLKLIRVDAQNNLLYVQGAVPGMRGTLVVVRKARTGVLRQAQPKQKK